jgi:hypothetical protein
MNNDISRERALEAAKKLKDDQKYWMDLYYKEPDPREFYCDDEMMATYTNSGEICCFSFNPNTKQSTTSYYKNCTLSEAVDKFNKKIIRKLKNEKTK